MGGGDWLRHVPAGDNRERLVCPDCGFVNYQNPKIVVGSVASHEGRILLCRRSINPRRGFWTLPAGYLENHETVEDGARREAAEEALARLTIDALLAVYNIPRISQVQLIHRARIDNPDGIGAGEETEAVGLFDWADIPWDDLAFPSVRWALEHWRAVAEATRFAPFTNPPGETGDY
ncbi:NUDIX hydrolase [Marivibrio halodurans]|uniref:NUDIX hydrolase n=1 Tax=Marivibrio halodurans TaxID=2039722 RepID=A0A8J7SQ13_9PROT|nr:NUDIX hydrolase [Marivibrio halodurans]MBP5858963.1 NUDIX hydrolase [Marivibrio halodurans]